MIACDDKPRNTMNAPEISPLYVKAIANRLEAFRSQVPSEPEHPIITRQWLADLNVLLLQCADGLRQEAQRVAWQSGKR